ncbi:M48 family metalloprotease [Mucilaginibacter sp. BJC16-A38]|uniref:M56 family metallopeptidase n=1 Tax=Mucilaginibacter phenanthrenivorans TaxID=1234842 RepID=UPI0021589F70|nr:M56 family metallopeptidase [Mucilaginibacter phenanthrenivorans]MCR8558415.1 M48 family metalloprotease [Mucilaginibacter phenanthrenivorans]
MQNTLYNISQVLGITIIHSLWQGLLIYFVLKLALMFSAQLSASKKYLMALISLFAITGWFGYTLIGEINIYNWLAVAPTKLSAMPLLTELPSGIARFNDQTIRYYYSVEEYLPYITAIYIVGLIFNTGKLVMARKKINAIKQGLTIDIRLRQTVNKFTAMLNISKEVKAGLSKMVDVPCMVGYFKPVILLPFSLATFLSAEEIEAILLHELAHIKRNDYLVNMLQQVISILLFFNPCAQLINRIINEERENCCDDLVVEATADPIIYAKALLKLEQTRQNDWQLALAATGKKYHLLNRIERIMKTKKQIPSLRPTLLAMLILTVGIGAMALLKPEIAQGKISVKAITPIIEHLLADTGRKAVAKKAVHTQAHATKKAVHKMQSDAHVNDESDDAMSYSDDENNSKMAALSAEIQKHSQAISAYYQSAEFKDAQRKIEDDGKAMQDFYNRPELKKMQEDLQAASRDYSKNFGPDDKMRAITEQMGEKGRKIGAYYSTPEFKKLNSDLKKKYGIPETNYYYDDRDKKSDNYKKYQAELETHIPADIKITQDDLEKMGKQVSAHYDSPEAKEQNRRVQALGDSLRKAYENPEIKEKQKEMERLGRQMSGYQDNEQIRNEQRLLQQAVKKMTAYERSPQYRKYLKSKMNFSYNFNYDSDEKPEKVEKTEKAERKEKREKTEKAEKVEKVEKSEKSEDE